MPKLVLGGWLHSDARPWQEYCEEEYYTPISLMNIV